MIKMKEIIERVFLRLVVKVFIVLEEEEIGMMKLWKDRGNPMICHGYLGITLKRLKNEGLVQIRREGAQNYIKLTKKGVVLKGLFLKLEKLISQREG